jgi:adenine C2-methylase RlmN of 23S rRNA A2503 and tRNA A37
MAAYVAGLNEKPFRAKQLMQWIHQRGVSDINDMSDLAKSFRATLLDKAEVLSLPIIKDEHAHDGTRKWLLDVGAGNAVESVLFQKMIEAHCASLHRQDVQLIAVFALRDIKAFHAISLPVKSLVNCGLLSISCVMIRKLYVESKNIQHQVGSTQAV